MKITVINGTEKHGVTYRLKEIFLNNFRDKAEITEFYLPKDCPGFCVGCTACFLTQQDKCKDAEYVQKIEKALREADLLVFTSPAYVYHATGAMKSMLDHFGYRWMPHRPMKEMFGKKSPDHHAVSGRRRQINGEGHRRFTLMVGRVVY